FLCRQKRQLYYPCPLCTIRCVLLLFCQHYTMKLHHSSTYFWMICRDIRSRIQELLHQVLISDSLLAYCISNAIQPSLNFYQDKKCYYLPNLFSDLSL